MAQKELRRMNRVELIEIIYALEQNEEELKQENQELRKKLEERKVVVENAGFIAEAVAGLNHIFDTAQRTADDYLASVAAVKEEAEREAERIVNEAKEEAGRIIADAEKTDRRKIRRRRRQKWKSRDGGFHPYRILQR